MEVKRDILWRVYLCFLGIVVFSLLILGRAAYIQQVQGKYWVSLSDSLRQKFVETEAERGTIFSEDGNMLSTSIPYFNIYIDFGADGLREKDGKRFKDNVDSLSTALAAFFKDKSTKEYKKELQRGYREKNRYYSLKKNLSFEQYKVLRNFPLVKQGRNKSGFIAEVKSRRLNPFGLLANRTIGLARENAQNVGIERTYDSLLKGETGKKLVRFVGAGAYIPVEGYEIEPRNGKDIVTTIDVNIQDIAESALLKMMIGNEAAHGTCIVMEVKTGKIKAIANLGKLSDGNYWEDLNYAIRASEPGSTFKLATMIALLEDKYVSLENHVNLEGGTWKIYRRTVYDSERHGLNDVTIKQAFEHSSNVGMAKLACAYYTKKPEQFIAHLRKLRLDQPSGIDLLGETRPIIKNPTSRTWSATTLPWMSFGYEVLVSPLQTLMIYNAVANNGKMMKPYLVNEIHQGGVLVEKKDPEVMVESICSDATLKQLKECLEGVLTDGTGKALQTVDYTIAGKTGTALVANGNRGYADHIYQSSFAGYFPANDPQYSCIVVIKNKPFARKYYGAMVAGPVFREVSDKLMAVSADKNEMLVAKSPVLKPDSSTYYYAAYTPAVKEVYNTLKYAYKDSSSSSEWSRVYAYNYQPVLNKQTITKQVMPDLKGMGLRDALYLLENMNVKVLVKGKGRVTRQSLDAGAPFSEEPIRRSRTELMPLLQDILYKVPIRSVKGSLDVDIANLQMDSRKVGKGSAFIAIRGAAMDGHQFIPHVVAAGAAAVVCEVLPQTMNEGTTYVLVDNTAVAAAYMAHNFFGQPSEKLKLVGVTGTNGKTTIATLLFKLFRELGFSCGLISTVQNQIDDAIIPATHTTPDAISLNALLKQMLETGCTYVFMESSSHAIHQHRITGLKYSGGIFSNITHDHLDYHKTFDEYIRIKKLFFDSLPSDAFAISNADDKRGSVMLQNTHAKKYLYSLRTLADFKGKILENGLTGLVMTVNDQEVHFRLIGEFNAYNLLAVYGAAICLGQDKHEVLRHMSVLTGAEGRFDYILSAKERIIGIVDYAHTPDALLNVLATIKNLRTGHEQIITVVGCGGDRDKTKRPVMGDVACEHSDRVIFTSDNPRSEDPEQIIRDMEAGLGVSAKRKYIAITDRREAIKTAVSMAKQEDIVLVAGKGHEKYQEVKGVKNHFDDKEVLREMFELLEK